jgi:hypothetical protein
MTKSVLPHDPTHDDPAFEHEVRAMLTRRAADVLPTPAAPPAELIDLAGSRSTRPPTRRPMWAAAAAAVFVVAGLVAMVVSGPDQDRAATTAETTATSAGEGALDPSSSPVWPVVGDHALADLLADPGDLGDDLKTPQGAAAAYLAAVAPAAAIDPGEADVGPVDGTARVPWSFSDDGAPPPFTGTIDLRDAGTTEGPVWVVVGAETDGLSVGGFRADDNSLQFSVEVSDPLTESTLSLRVGVDGEYVSVGGEPLPQGAADPDPSSGEIVKPGDDRPMIFDVPAGRDADVEILVRAVGGTFLTTSHVGLHLPPSPEPTANADPPEAPAAPVAPSVDVTAPDAPATEVPTHVEGTFRGDEQYRPTDGGCPDLDHVLTSTFALTDGTTWAFRAEYCGTLQGDTWSGGGTFGFTTPEADTLTGTFTSSASVTSDGEPYALTITSGTGRYAGASGSCALDNHLTDTAPWAQEHHGSFSCEITAPTGG